MFQTFYRKHLLINNWSPGFYRSIPEDIKTRKNLIKNISWQIYVWWVILSTNWVSASIKIQFITDFNIFLPLLCSTLFCSVLYEMWLMKQHLGRKKCYEFLWIFHEYFIEKKRKRRLIDSWFISLSSFNHPKQDAKLFFAARLGTMKFSFSLHRSDRDRDMKTKRDVRYEHAAVNEGIRFIGKYFHRALDVNLRLSGK